MGSQSMKPQAAGRKLYRNVAITATGLAALLLLVANTAAQKGRKQSKLRSIAVVEWRTGSNGKAEPRLLPIAVFENGKYYDGSVYKATPLPISLEEGNLYEAQEHGARIGYFTVERALIPEGTDPDKPRHWIGVGSFEDAVPPDDSHMRDPHLASSASTGTPKAADPNYNPNDESELHRKTVTVYDEQGHPVSAEDAAKQPEPVKKQGNPAPLEREPQVTKDKPAPKIANPDEDADRPRLKRSTSESTDKPASTPEPAAAPANTQAPGDTHVQKPADVSHYDDPDRPRLQRGKPTGQGKGAATAHKSSDPALVAVQQKGATEIDGVNSYFAVAFSDAETTDERPRYRFLMAPSEEEENTTKMVALAQVEVEKFLKRVAPTTATPLSTIWTTTIPPNWCLLRRRTMGPTPSM